MSSFDQSQNWEKSKVAFLPVKPVYAEKLINGTKHFEFRRRPMSADVTHIVVYASSPYKRILGIVSVSSVQSGSVRSVWNRTKECAGISRSDYFDYFAGVDVAYAIAIDPEKTIRFGEHISPNEIEEDFVVPQSFKYVDFDFLQALLARSG
jgi:predicted transcriptional regulator